MFQKNVSYTCCTIKLDYSKAKSYASTLINNNVPITVVQNRLGHTEPETTFRYYAFNNTDKSKQDEMVRNALNKRFEG